jgi:uncharacterized protein (DUF342 family)
MVNMGNRNGYFQLEIKKDGTYLKLFPPLDNGQHITYDEVSNYLIDKKIHDYDIKALGRAIATSHDEPTEVKLLTITILPESEYLKISISSDRMLVIGRFYPPSNNGQLMSASEMVSTLQMSGIKHGIIRENIESFIQDRRYCEDIVLARGTKPVEGKNAVIRYHFNTDTTLKPKENEDGTVDFHQLDMISSTNAGDILATLEPAVSGKDGVDVCGNIIKPAKVTKLILRHGKGIHMSEDGLTMYSDTNGHVMLQDDRVFVANTFEVPANVDASTGDIIYEGNVKVKGNIITGYTVQAKGDIIVDGVVEGATLIAGGHIILKRGMQGMSRGKMEADGNIITKFIENATVKAGGYITTEAILHSKVSAQGDITVGGKKGFVTGGEIRSTSCIIVKTAGSTMGTHTLLEVGIDPTIVEEYHQLEVQIASCKADRDKLMPILSTFKKKIANGEYISPEKFEYIKLATKNVIDLDEKIRVYMLRYEKLKLDMNNTEGGSIRIENIGYPGVKIVISNVVYYVRNEVQYTKFIRDRADIKLVGL